MEHVATKRSHKRPRPESRRKIRQLHLSEDGSFTAVYVGDDGDDDMPTRKTEEELLSEGLHPSLLRRIKEKTTKARPTKLVGYWFGASDEQVLPHLAIHVPPKFGCALDRGVPYSLLNLLDAKKRAAQRLIKNFGALGTLSELCDHAGSLFRKRLKPIKESSISWLLEQSTGLFLVVDELQCVGVDCVRQLVFDGGQPYALHLSREALLACGIIKLDEVRQIILKKKFFIYCV